MFPTVFLAFPVMYARHLETGILTYNFIHLDLKIKNPILRSNTCNIFGHPTVDITSITDELHAVDIFFHNLQFSIMNTERAGWQWR
jgi:hypothetical protein